MSAQRGIGSWMGRLVFVLVGGFLLGATAQAQNVAPTISGTPPTTATVGKAYLFQPSAFGRQRRPADLHRLGRPELGRVRPQDRPVSGTPTTRHAGSSYTLSDQRVGRQAQRVAAAVHDHRPVGYLDHRGRRPHDLRHAGDHGGRGRAVRLPALGERPQRRPAAVQRLRQAELGQFAAKSGLLSGIPPAGAAGTYPNIVISVSDGKTSVSLAPFSITVTASRTVRPPSGASRGRR
jgi:hypothetical protein